MSDHPILIALSALAVVFVVTYIVFRLWLRRQARLGFEYQRKDS